MWCDIPTHGWKVSQLGLSQYKDGFSGYENCQYKHKTVVRRSYLSNGDPYTGKTTSLYADGPQAIFQHFCSDAAHTTWWKRNWFDYIFMGPCWCETTISNAFSYMKIVFIQMSLKYLHWGLINYSLVLVQIMFLCRTGDRWWLGTEQATGIGLAPNRRQALIWANDDAV